MNLDDTKEGELLGILANTGNSPKMRGNAAGELAFRISRMKSEIERLKDPAASGAGVAKSHDGGWVQYLYWVDADGERHEGWHPTLKAMGLTGD